MADWWDLVSESTGVQSVYGNDVPPLLGLDLHEVRLHHDGPSLILRFDLPWFPSAAPEKWRIKGFNTVQLELRADVIRTVSMNGWNTRPIVDLDLRKEGESIQIRVSGSDINIEAIADFCVISSMSAYLNGLE